MRRGLAALLMSLSMVLASLAWAGFVMLHTVLDPGRSASVAQQMIDNDQVRSAITGRLADLMIDRIPSDVPMPDEVVDRAAGAAVDDPAVQTAIVEAITTAHRNALEGIDEPVTVAGDALARAGREALVENDGALESALPSMSDLTVELPTTGFAWIGRLRDLLERFVNLAGAASLIGVAASFVISPNRPAILRRVAYWAFGASAFWLIVAFGLPRVADLLAPSSTALVNAVIEIFFGAMIGPALALAAFGAGALAASFILPHLLWRQGADAIAPAPAGAVAARPAATTRPVPFDQPGLRQRAVRPPDPTELPDRDQWQRARAAEAAEAARAQQAQAAAQAHVAAQAAHDRTARTHADAGHSPAPTGPGGTRRLDRTEEIPVVPAAAVPPHFGPTGPAEELNPLNPVNPLSPAEGPRWVEGQGYVDDEPSRSSEASIQSNSSPST